MVQKIGTKKKKTMRNSNARVALAKKAKRSNGEKKKKQQQKRREGRWTTERRWRMCRRRCGLTTRPCGPHRLVLASQPCCVCLLLFSVNAVNE